MHRREFFAIYEGIDCIEDSCLPFTRAQIAQKMVFCHLRGHRLHRRWFFTICEGIDCIEDGFLPFARDRGSFINLLNATGRGVAGHSLSVNCHLRGVASHF